MSKVISGKRRATERLSRPVPVRSTGSGDDGGRVANGLHGGVLLLAAGAVGGGGRGMSQSELISRLLLRAGGDKSPVHRRRIAVQHVYVTCIPSGPE